MNSSSGGKSNSSSGGGYGYQVLPVLKSSGQYAIKEKLGPP
jgi:hypothetical protein